MALPDQQIRDLPPSAKLVLKVLEYNGGLTQKQIVNKSRLSQRTVRDALERLQDRSIVDKNIYVPDARQNLYTLSGPAEEEAAEAEVTLD
ncbi:MAG: helix-turn-helix transcriptional regulator [Halodesulfurarchaeum sp.]